MRAFNTGIVLLALSGSKLKPLFTFQAGLHPVIGDPVQLTQVIENLVINACEAIRRKVGSRFVPRMSIRRVPPRLIFRLGST